MDAEHPNYNITTNATAPRTPLPFILPAFYISLLLVTIAFVLLTILAHKIAALKICQRKDEINLLEELLVYLGLLFFPILYLRILFFTRCLLHLFQKVF